MKRARIAVLLAFALALPPPCSVRAQDVPDPRALALSPDLSFADPIDPNPGDGRIKRVVGWASLGVGVVEGTNVVLCARVEALRGSRSRRKCVTLAASLAALGFLIGIPLTVSGRRQRLAKKAWLKRHGLALLEHLSADADREGARLGWQLRF